MGLGLAWLLPRPAGRSEAADAVAVSSPALEPEPVPFATGRRDRAVDGADRVLLASLGEKVLHGWLQNRHQTLYPLTINLRQLNPLQRSALAQWLAVALLAARPDADTPDLNRQADARGWFATVGADSDALQALAGALAEPPALHHVAAAVVKCGITPHAYVAALIALDPNQPETAPFLDYTAARFALPTTVVRSATRRHRR